MPTLADRLRSLGVQKGAESLPAPRPRSTFPIEDVVPGRFLDNTGGTTFLTENIYDSSYKHGQVGLQFHTPLQMIAEWAGSTEITQNGLQDFAFLDTETSGLAGGAGTFAFLVGVGRFVGQDFQLIQFFMRDPYEEPAMLLALEEFLAHCKALVTFNGKSFDAPLLTTRYTLQGWPSPMKRMQHIDLLHLARRLWRERLPSRTLSNLEVQILGAQRSDEEIPGWMIPQMYFDFLRDGDARPLKSVFYHNVMDVLSMAALLNLVANLIEKPGTEANIPASDQAAMGRLYEDLGYFDLADQSYMTCIGLEQPAEQRVKAILCLAALRKRRGDFSNALPLWEQAAGEGCIDAFIELAKYYEHRARDIQAALYWARKAHELISTPRFPSLLSNLWQAEINHRLERLSKKNGGNQG
jgi:uncharacterized protein YprB with RNaseH-like and TPR domain